MGIDVVQIARRNAGGNQRIANHRGKSPTRTTGIKAGGKAKHLGLDVCLACQGMVQRFEQDDARTFAEDLTVAVHVKGTTGLPRCVIACRQLAEPIITAQRVGVDARVGAARQHGDRPVHREDRSPRRPPARRRRRTG